MPGFDGTGPRGEGPLTGGGRGYCVGYPAQVLRRGPAGYGQGFGRGFGRGRGMGRGFGRRWRGYPYVDGVSYGDPYAGKGVSAEDEIVSLKEEARAMQDRIDAINQRIKELDSAASSQGNE